MTENDFLEMTQNEKNRPDYYSTGLEEFKTSKMKS